MNGNAVTEGRSEPKKLTIPAPHRFNGSLIVEQSNLIEEEPLCDVVRVVSIIHTPKKKSMQTDLVPFIPHENISMDYRRTCKIQTPKICGNKIYDLRFGEKLLDTPK